MRSDHSEDVRLFEESVSFYQAVEVSYTKLSRKIRYYILRLSGLGSEYFVHFSAEMTG